MFSVSAKGYDQWRSLTRELLKRHISPNNIAWESDQQNQLFSHAGDENFIALPIQQNEITISRDFLTLAKTVSCHRNDKRWSLLYSIAWRIIFEDTLLLNNRIDPQVSQAFSLFKAVNRDVHKMKAFVRFRSVEFTQSQEALLTDKKVKNDREYEEYFVAWFEPEHKILPLVTSFFTHRFANMPWSILTPDACLHWDGSKTTLTDGVCRPKSLEDDLDNLWKKYYANIFNPARLKLKAMQSEMPKKYWKNLPEAPLIASLTKSSMYRTETMINTAPTLSSPKLLYRLAPSKKRKRQANK